MAFPPFPLIIYNNHKKITQAMITSTMNVPFSDYNGNLTSKQCGSVGGEMVKRMVEQYEKGL